jgi:hypothetical protein
VTLEQFVFEFLQIFRANRFTISSYSYIATKNVPHYGQCDITVMFYICCAACLCQAKLLLATYNDETVNVDMDVNICNYKQAVDACRQWEKSSVCLAQYYDRVLGVMSEDERNTRGGYVVLYIVLCACMRSWEIYGFGSSCQVYC